MAVHFSPSFFGAFLNTGYAVLTRPPISYFARFNQDAPKDVSLIVINRSIEQGFTDANHFFMDLNPDGLVYAYANGAGLFNDASSVTGTFSTNVWQSAGATWATASVIAYCNGTAGPPGTNPIIQNGIYGDTQIGGRVQHSGVLFKAFNGCMAEIAIWDGITSPDEQQAMANGISPRLIQPQNLVLFVRAQDLASLTVNLCGAPVTANANDGSFSNCTDSPRIILPNGFSVGKGIVTPPSPTTSRRFYFIERMDDRLWPTVENAWCLDAALQYPMPAPNATLYASSAVGDRAIRSYNIINGGSGYTAPIGQIEDVEGDGSGATVSFGLTSGVITTATATAIGADYVHPVLTILDLTGEGAAVLPIVTGYATFSATANVFDSGNLGDIIRMGGGKAEVVSVGGGTSVIGNIIMPILGITPNDPDETPLPATSGNWTVTTPTTTVSGLWHLEGMTVNALADGGVVTDLTVEDGAITLPVEATAIVAGLPMLPQLQTLYVEAQGGGTIQSRRKSDFQVVIRVENSRAPEVGVNQPDAAAQPGGFNVPWTGMTQIRERSVNVPPGQPVPLYSGDYDPTNVFGTWDTRGQVAIQQSNPLPLSITAVVPWIKVGDTPS